MKLKRVGMIFIPCFKGYSHRPDEHSTEDQMRKGVETLALTMAKLSRERPIVEDHEDEQEHEAFFISRTHLRGRRKNRPARTERRVVIQIYTRVTRKNVTDMQNRVTLSIQYIILPFSTHHPLVFSFVFF